MEYPSTAPRSKAVVAWSSGKDSAYALWESRRSGELDIVGLLTTVTETFQRVSMHGVRESLLAAQAAACGLPLWKVPIPFPCPNRVYEERMAAAAASLRAAGVSHVVFGDLFLEDVRSYREAQMRAARMTPTFPLWGRDTRVLAKEMIQSGLRARLVALDPRRIAPTFAGRWFDHDLLNDLPEDVDPCGENGEFHTFATAGPMFGHPLDPKIGETVERDGFVFTDLLLR